jgi:iron complex transport system substrate-binding protein
MRDEMTDPTFSRRTLLRGFVALTAGTALTGLLAACGGDDDDDDDSAGTTATTGQAAATNTTAAPAATNTAPAAATTNPPASTATMAGSGEWTFTDDRDITITKEQRPTRIIAQIAVAAALWDYGIRPIGVFGPARLPDGTPAPQSGAVDLDTVESVGEVQGEIDIEKVIALAPDLIISSVVGDFFVGDNDEVLKLVEETAPRLGILIRGVPISHTLDRIYELAGALGADLDAPEVVEAKERYDAAVEELEAAIDAKPGLTVMFTSASPELLYVAKPQGFADLTFFEELGMDIVTPEEEGAVWGELSWEQAPKYEADLILNDARPGVEFTLPEEIATIPIWNELPAVQAEQVGPWYLLNIIPSYNGYAPVMEEMTEWIEMADPDVV